MAEALLTLMFKNLNSLIQKGFGLLWGVNKEMEKLSSILSTIRAVLEDAEEKQLRNRAIKNWLQKLNDVSGELDDILDECSAEASLLEYKTKRFGSTQKVKASFLNCLNPKNTRFRFQIAKKMEDVTERLDDIAKEREKFHLREVVEDQRHVQVRNKRDTGSIVDEKQVYGREEDKDKIVEFLVESNSSNSKDCPSTCAIVGMGGIGKTTLAKLVYNDPRVTEHFDMKIWVCVSGDFDVWRLIKAIIESASGNACEALDIDPLQKRLQNMLERKKFLLVLDDVWNEDKDKWEGLGNVLACGLNGSSIVVTTRLEKVASIMGATQMHHISSLSEDECWLLFSQRAFGSESEKRPSLVKIGKEIVKKCKGNPLAAKSLGSLMYSKFEEQQWLLVKESELWQIDETSILPALRLSYYQLTSQLRRCFAFCAIFPKDFEIKKEKLIHLWMANGLIFSKENMEVEEMGNEICNELYWRSFFQDAEKDEFGNIKSFKMHDLVHDLAQCIMKDECTVTKSDLPDIFSTFYNGKSLRTLLLLPMSSSMAQARLPHSLYFPSLRAFDRQDIFISELKLKTISSLISNSIHLRYLNLSRTKIRFLPESICLLVNLQTLDVRLCGKLEKLPKHMSRLRSLRHLYIEGCLSLNQMPPNIGKLSCLRSLSRFIVYRRRGYDIDELGSLLNLGGSLRIEQLEKVRSPMEAKKANLVGKTNLETLHLCWCDNLNEVGDQKLSEQGNKVLDMSVTTTLLQTMNLHQLLQQPLRCRKTDNKAPHAHWWF
nr:putative disease resistance protein RGA3 isoform X2 [Ziziphus jujuba var. spinosa]